MGGPEKVKCPKIIFFNSPTDKLSNDDPHDYGTLKYKIPAFKGYKGSIRAPVGDQNGPKCPKLFFFNSRTDKLSNDAPHAYSRSKNKIRVFWGRGPYLGASI